MTDQARLSWALALSVLLHLTMLALLPLLRRLELPMPPAAPMEVDLAQLPPRAPKPAPVPKAAALPETAAEPKALPPMVLPERQIVSPPDAGEERPPEKTRLLSDRDNTVKEEMIRRGEPLPGDPDAAVKPAARKPERAPAKAAVAAPPEQVAALPKLDQLLPHVGDIVRQGLVPTPAPPGGVAEADPHRNLLAHGEPWKSAPIRPGTLDALPLREGDITLLNTKAEAFAPFVRRVALRVFANFMILVRRDVFSGHAEAAQEYVTMEAVMSKSGNLVSLTMKDRSSTSLYGTDRNLRQACDQGFFDRNPPPGAEAADGNIHFLLSAQLVLAIDPRSNRPDGYAAFTAGLL